jgi:hypothetical protein
MNCMSGWLFRTSETRDLETDSFENPGMIAVEDGEACGTRSKARQASPALRATVMRRKA